MTRPEGWLTPEQLDQAEREARRFSGAWTGTSGSLASWVVFLVKMVRHLQSETETVTDPSHPGYGAAVVTAAESLLTHATNVIRQRRQTYGPPREHFARTVAAVNAIFAHKLAEPLTESDWAQIMILDKLARHQGAAKSSDTPIDLAGYAACLAECEAAP